MGTSRNAWRPLKRAGVIAGQAAVMLALVATWPFWVIVLALYVAWLARLDD